MDIFWNSPKVDKTEDQQILIKRIQWWIHIKKQRRNVFKLLPNLGVHMTITLRKQGTLNAGLGNSTFKETEQKVHVHMSKCQKDFACRFRQNKWIIGNISHFVVLAILI